MTNQNVPVPIMQHTTPGPGSYKPGGGFENIKNTMQSAKTLMKFGLDQHFGIQVMKPSMGFASRVHRFQETGLVDAKAGNAPGPGSYNPPAP